MIHQSLQASNIQYADVFLLDSNVPFFLEARERPGNSFQLEAEVTADLFARHAQVELSMGKATGCEAL